MHTVRSQTLGQLRLCGHNWLDTGVLTSPHVEDILNLPGTTQVWWPCWGFCVDLDTAERITQAGG